MRKALGTLTLVTALLLAMSATAADKVVVIPLGKSAAKVGGTDMQVQYNDNGTLAGANVYYDKTYGWLGIGDNTPRSNLNVFGGTDAGVLIESPPSEILLYTKPSGENRIEMFGNAANSIKMFTASDTQSAKPYILGGRLRGSVSTALGVQGGDHLFGVFASGYNGTTDESIEESTAGIAFFATETWTDASRGTAMAFFTRESGQSDKAKRMHIHQNGYVGIGTAAPPTSTLQINGYIQLALTAGLPPSEDCDATTRGRMIVDNAAGTLYICMDSGWVAK